MSKAIFYLPYTKEPRVAGVYIPAQSFYCPIRHLLSMNLCVLLSLLYASPTSSGGNQLQRSPQCALFC